MKKTPLESPKSAPSQCLEIVETAAMTIDTLLRTSAQTIGLSTIVKDQFNTIKNKLIYKMGATSSGETVALQSGDPFPPMTSFMGQKIVAQKEIDAVDTSPSEFKIYKNPDQAGYKKRIYSEMYTGRLRNLIIQRMRPGVEALLKKDHSDEYAADIYPAICEMIIKIHLFSTRDGFKNLAFDPKIVTQYKLDYPWEFNFLEGVNKWIEEDNTLEKIEKLLFKKLTDSLAGFHF